MTKRPLYGCEPAMRAQTSFERGQKAERRKWILHVAAINPDLPLYLLAERFHMTQDSMRAILGREDCARRAKAQLTERECRRSIGPGPARQFNPWRHK